MRMSIDTETRSCAEGLRLALAFAAGVSGGAADHFASFFFSGLAVHGPLEQMPLAGVKEVEVEGIACWQIATRQAERTPEFKASQAKALSEIGWEPEAIAEFLVDGERTVTLSICLQDMLLRRIQKGHRIETRRNVQSDMPLPDDVFENGPRAHLPFGS
jgi:hypothetical protein